MTFKTNSKAHPWHGISPHGIPQHGISAPSINTSSALTCFIEIVPGDTVKYEIDKASGYLKIDRPQKYSNVCPVLYGFIPQTYCGKLVGDYCKEKAKRTDNIVGDGDPLDICILTEKLITHGDILVEAIPIGGLRMIDKNEADDKIIAVLKDDAVYGHLNDVSDLPESLIDRLRHYFLTYKQLPEEKDRRVEIESVYSKEIALEVIEKSFVDYQNSFGNK